MPRSNDLTDLQRDLAYVRARIRQADRAESDGRLTDQEALQAAQRVRREHAIELSRQLADMLAKDNDE